MPCLFLTFDCLFRVVPCFVLMRSRHFRVMPCFVLMSEFVSVSCRVFVLDQHCEPFRIMEIVMFSVLFRVFFDALFGFPCRLVFVSFVFLRVLC